MLSELLALISAFRSAQDRAVQFLTSVCRLEAPASNRAWCTYSGRDELCRLASLHGTPIRIHGYGIEVRFADCTIDFDWGDAGEADGFDAWRLWNFSLDNQLDSPFQGQLEIQALLDGAHEQGELRKDRCLYYLVRPKAQNRPCLWLIEPGVPGLGEDALAAEVRRQGHEARVLPCSQWRQAVESRSEPIIFRGSVGGVAAFVDLTPFDLRRYSHSLAPFLLNRDGRELSVGELLTANDELFDTMGVEGRLFLRPCRGNKVFDGEVTFEKYFDADVRSLLAQGVDPGERVWVAPTVELEKEWRFVAVGDRIACGSEYWTHARETEFPAPVPEALAFATEVARTFPEPPVAWVLDVAHTSTGQLRLVELNSFACSGLYSCPLEPLVREISAQHG